MGGVSLPTGVGLVGGVPGLIAEGVGRAAEDAASTPAQQETTQAGTPVTIDQGLIDAINAAAGRIGEAEFGAITPEQQAAATSQIGGLLSNLGGVGAQQQAIGLGQATDPRFEQFRTSQIGALSRTQQEQQARQSEFFNRRGIGGSSAALNQQNRLSTQFGEQQQALTSQIGLQEIANQQQALQTALGIGTQQAGLVGQQFGINQAAVQSQNEAQKLALATEAARIETLSLPEQLRIAGIAAQNAGTVNTGGGGSGGLFK